MQLCAKTVIQQTHLEDIQNKIRTADSRNCVVKQKSHTCLLSIDYLANNFLKCVCVYIQIDRFNRVARTYTYNGYFPGISVVKICLPSSRQGFSPGMGNIPWKRKWQYTPVFLFEKSHRQRSLLGSMGLQRFRHYLAIKQ